MQNANICYKPKITYVRYVVISVPSVRRYRTTGTPLGRYNQNKEVEKTTA